MNQCEQAKHATRLLAGVHLKLILKLRLLHWMEAQRLRSLIQDANQHSALF